MISSVNSFSSSSVSLLFGTPASAATTSASAAQQLLADVTGHTDDALKTGNAIGNIIEIASRMKQESASAGRAAEVEELDLPKGKGFIFDEFDGDNEWHGVKGTLTTTYNEKGERIRTFVGTGMGMTDEAHRQMMIDGLEKDQSTLRNRAALAAYKNGTMQETDIAELGFQAVMVRVTQYFNDGSASMRTTPDSTSVVPQFREQYTETRDGVLYDKATGKFAAIGQNGSKFTYLTW